jgi:hypothetical protein
MHQRSKTISITIVMILKWISDSKTYSNSSAKYIIICRLSPYLWCIPLETKSKFQIFLRQWRSPTWSLTPFCSKNNMLKFKLLNQTTKYTKASSFGFQIKIWTRKNNDLVETNISLNNSIQNSRQKPLTRQ